MSRLLIILVLLFSTGNVFAGLITLDFEDGTIPSFSVSGNHNRLLPPFGDNGYGVLADFSASDYVGFSYASPGAEIEFESQAGSFDLVELSMVGAWGSQTATLIGYKGVFATHSLEVSLDRFTVDNLLLGWSDLTSFSIVSGTDFIHQPGHSCCGTVNSNQIGFDNIIVDMYSFQLPGGGGSQNPDDSSDDGSGGSGTGGSGTGGDGGSVQVSEPSTMMLLILGLAGLCCNRRARRS